MGGRSNTLNPLNPLAPDERGAGWMRRLPTKSHLKFQQKTHGCSSDYLEYDAHNQNPFPFAFAMGEDEPHRMIFTEIRMRKTSAKPRNVRGAKLLTYREL